MTSTGTTAAPRGARSACAAIFGSTPVIALLLIPFFKTSGFGAVPYLSEICNGMLALECAVFLPLALLRGRLSPPAVMLALYGVWTQVISPLLFGTTPPGLFYICGALGLVCLLELCAEYDSARMLRALSGVCAFMVALNAALLTLFPEGLYISGGPVHLFGFRTGFTMVVLPSLLFCTLSDKLSGRARFSAKTAVCLLCSLFALVQQWVATGIAALMVVAAMYLAARLLRGKRFLGVGWLVAAIMALDLFVTVVGIQSGLLARLFALLGRDATMTGRTFIWEAVLARARERLIPGFGLDTIVLVNEQQKAAHNLWLHYLLEGGLVGLALMLLALGFYCARLARLRPGGTYALFVIFTAALLIASIVEILIYVPLLYAVYELPYLIEACPGSRGDEVPRLPRPCYRIV